MLLHLNVILAVILFTLLISIIFLIGAGLFYPLTFSGLIFLIPFTLVFLKIRPVFSKKGKEQHLNTSYKFPKAFEADPGARTALLSLFHIYPYIGNEIRQLRQEQISSDNKKAYRNLIWINRGALLMYSIAMLLIPVSLLLNGYFLIHSNGGYWRGFIKTIFQAVIFLVPMLFFVIFYLSRYPDKKNSMLKRNNQIILIKERQI